DDGDVASPHKIITATTYFECSRMAPYCDAVSWYGVGYAGAWTYAGNTASAACILPSARFGPAGDGLGLWSRLYGGDLRAQLLPIALVSIIPPEAIGVRHNTLRRCVAERHWPRLSVRSYHETPQWLP